MSLTLQVICAPTGSGKTLCYVIPILNALYKMNGSAGSPKILALVVVPVKDLAMQIYKVESEALEVSTQIFTADFRSSSSMEAIAGTLCSSADMPTMKTNEGLFSPRTAEIALYAC